MNAKLVVAAGIVATVLGLGPTIASADPYFSLFLGKGSNDASRNDLNTFASAQTVALGGTSPTGTSDLNDKDSVWGVQAGYRFNRWVAAEIGYVDLGKASYVANLVSDFGIGIGNEAYQVRGRFISAGPTIAVLGMIPLGERFDLYGRGGVYFADTRFRARFVFSDGILTAEEKAGTQELFGGLGFAWNINDSYGMRFEASHFLDVGDDDRTGEASVTMVTLGVLFR